jgi:alcohol dehydrogenase (quinone), cytochrome c subunit
MSRLITTIGVLAVVFFGALFYALWPTTTRAIPPTQTAVADAVAVERGRYLAAAGDCSACHTAPGDKPFAGGLAIASPVGVIYSTNITPDPESGIGGFTLDDFDRAVRHGIGKNGGTLYPAMPYPSYARITDEDIAALYSYFMRGVQPVLTVRRANGIAWPLSIRWPVAIWRKLFAPAPDAAPFNAARFSDPQVARGAYLVEGPGHCGTCHTPRAITLQEKALDDSSSVYLAGGQLVDGWVAVNLRGNTADGLGAWSAEDIVATLRSARNSTHAVVGAPMNDVILHSTQQLSDEDLKAIAAYLKTLAPSTGDESKFAANPATGAALAAGRESDRGAQLYDDNCSACHRSDGNGSRNALPSIAGNPTVLSSDTATLVRLVLGGASLPGTAAAPSPLGMPGFAWRLSNAEVADLLTFIRSNWGNQASSVSASDVARIRASMDAERAGTIAAAH